MPHREAPLPEELGKWCSEEEKTLLVNRQTEHWRARPDLECQW